MNEYTGLQDGPEHLLDKLRSFARRWYRRPREPRALKIGSLEDRLLFSATPISPEMLIDDGAAAAETSVAVYPENATADVDTENAIMDPWGRNFSEDDTTENLLEIGFLLEQTGEESPTDVSQSADAYTTEFRGFFLPPDDDLGSDSIDISGNEASVWAATADDAAIVESSQADQIVRRELVFVDASVQNYQQLAGDLLGADDDRRQIEVVLLKSDQDGIEQITETLSSYDSLDAVHVVSYGTDESVKLGEAWLSMDSMDAYAGAIATWSDALSGDANLVLHGLDPAGSEQSQTLVEAIGQLSGADAVATTEDTGQAILSGTWGAGGPEIATTAATSSTLR